MTAAAPPGPPGDQPDDRPVLPDRADDDRDEGWGEREPDSDRRLWEDRPPHHDGRSLS